MPDTFSFGEPEVAATMEERPGLAEPETPFRIALMGDWSGRRNRRTPAQSIEERKPLLIDRDNFDEVMARLNIILRLPVTDDGPHLTLSFRELDDFHPDRIFERVSLFDALRDTRERLEDSSTFEEAARRVREWANAGDRHETQAPSGEQSETASETSAPIDGGSLLEQMLAESDEATEAKPAAADDDLQAMLREVVRPHLVSFDEAEQEQLVASVDEATSRLMRSILHHADFQSLEAAWRAAYFLTSNLETGTDLKLYLLDVTKEELASDLSATDKLEETGAYRLLAEQSVNTFGGDLWAMIAGNYTFEATRDDALMLGQLAKIAERAGAPFIAAAASNLVGCQSLAQTPDPDDWQAQIEQQDAEAWNALRQLEQASYVGLALPRFLLRLPYGALTEPTETFDFEEMSENPEHENYLWANPSFACAYLLAQSFTQFGWELQPGILQEIEGLPLHIYQHDGDSYIKPCAETILTMRAAEKILAQGLMPLISFQGRDMIRLARFQSVSEPLTSLSGRWS